MTTPFDKAIQEVSGVGYHNHRLETHSDIVSMAMFEDLLRSCDALRRDFESGVIKVWTNVRSPGDRLRKVDLFVGEPADNGELSVDKVRIAVENGCVPSLVEI